MVEVNNFSPRSRIGSSLWHRFHIAPLFVGDNKRHPGGHWCPDWDLTVNDRCTNPRAAHELITCSTLPRDVEFTKKLTPPELVQSLMVSSVSSSAFVAEMARRYSDLLKQQGSASCKTKSPSWRSNLPSPNPKRPTFRRNVTESRPRGKRIKPLSIPSNQP